MGKEILIIKQIAKKKNISMCEIAEKIGISPINLSTSLNGNPTLKRLSEVADILGVSVRDLFQDENKLPIGGYIEFNGKITKIETFLDLENVYNNIKNGNY